MCSTENWSVCSDETDLKRCDQLVEEPYLLNQPQSLDLLKQVEVKDCLRFSNNVFQKPAEKLYKTSLIVVVPCSFISGKLCGDVSEQQAVNIAKTDGILSTSNLHNDHYVGDQYDIDQATSLW